MDSQKPTKAVPEVVNFKIVAYPRPSSLDTLIITCQNFPLLMKNPIQ